MRAKFGLWVSLLVMSLGFFAANALAADIQVARNAAQAALQEVSKFNKHLDLVGRKAFVLNTSCRNARALIDRKRANLNGLAVQAIEKAIGQTEDVLELFPALLDFLPVIDEKIQSAADEIAELTQEGTLNPFRSNLILDKMQIARNLLPVMAQNIQSLSDRLGTDLAQAFDKGLAALEDDESLAAREAMNDCLDILREFEKQRKLVGQAQRGKVTKFLSDARLLMRALGPIGAGTSELGLESVAITLSEKTPEIELQLQLFSADGRLLAEHTLANTHRLREFSAMLKTFANGVYLVRLKTFSSDGVLIRTELKKIVIKD
jgi:hypothetical protein